MNKKLSGKKILLALLIIPCLNLPAAEKYTLQEAFARALLRAPQFQLKLLDEEAAQHRKTEALKRKRFVVDLEASFHTASDRVEVSMDSLRLPVDFLPGGKTILLAMPDNFYDFKLVLKQPLYSGGVLNRAVQLAEIEQEIRRELTLNEQLELAGRLKTSYYTCLMLQQSRISLQRLMDSLRLHLERVAALRREELLRESDLLETRIRLSELELRKLELESLLASEEAVFSSICGLEFATIEQSTPETDLTFSQALEKLQGEHPLSKAFDSRLRAQAVLRGLAAAKALPRLAAFAELHLARPGRNFFRDEWLLYAQFGLGLQMPVFNWGRTAAEISLADIEAEKTSQLSREFFSEAEKALRRLFAHKQGIESKLLVFSSLQADAAAEVGLKKALYEEGQLDHRSYLAALLSQEHYHSRGEENRIQLEIVKAQILVLAGQSLEEK